MAMNGNGATGFWSDPVQGPALMDHLAVLCHDGLSFGVIGVRLGISRSAAIGKAYRMNLSQPQMRVTLYDVDKKWRKKKQRLPRPVLPVKPDHRHDFYVPFGRLSNRTCRYPVWRDDTPVIERLFCGVPEADLLADRPFCKVHAKICYRAGY